MKKNDLEKRVERLEKDSHPPVAWKEKIEHLVKRIDHLYKISLFIKWGGLGDKMIEQFLIFK